MISQRFIFLLGLYLLAVSPVEHGPAATAGERAVHPVSITKAQVYVSREAIDVTIEIFLEDLLLFQGLQPNANDFLEPDILRAGAEKHQTFLEDRFEIRNFAGDPLTRSSWSIGDFDVPPEGVALGQLMAHTLEYQIRYELDEPPEFLTVLQSITDDDGLIPSEMSLSVKQENAGETVTATIGPDQPETIRFDWNAAPLSPEASQREREQWQAKQSEQALGITSYSSVYSFLYIEENEVRHEILIPLLTLEESVLVSRDDDEFLDLDEQRAARRQIEAYFRTGNPIDINGQRVKPRVDRCDFFGLDFKDFARQAEQKRVSLASARVGIILTYPTDEPVDSMSLVWDRFNNFLWTVNMVVFAFDDVSKVTLSRLDSSNRFDWQGDGRTQRPPIEPVLVQTPLRSTLSVPLLSVLCFAGAPLLLAFSRLKKMGSRFSQMGLIGLSGLGIVAIPFFRYDWANPFVAELKPSQTEQKSVFESLHQNLYRSFEYRDEESIYDALAKTIDGELLESVYLQVRRGLEMQEQGGAVSKIREVQILDSDMNAVDDSPQEGDTDFDPLGFRCRSRWNIAGTVEHWGHIHARTNQYEANFAIEPRNGAWKITGLELLDEKRVSFETSLRSL